MNRFTNYVWMATGFAVLAVTISALTPGSALAQIVKAALVKNVDEKGRMPFSKRVTCISGISSNFCSAAFPMVPAQRRLVITHVNALSQHSGGPGSDVTLRLVGSADLVVTAYFAPRYKGTSSGTIDDYLVNEPILAYFEAGETPRVEISARSNNLNVAAVISGYFIDLTI